MPTRIVYCGPFRDGEELPDGQIAKPGRPVEIDTELAEELLQRDTYARPTANDAKDAARQAKAPRKSGTQGDEG